MISRLREKGTVVWLESQMDDHPASSKSYLAAIPVASIKAFGNEIHIQKEEKKVIHSDPWTALKEFRDEYGDWLFGYLGYDLKNFVEDLGSDNPKLNNAPDMFFMVPGLLLEIDKNGSIDILKGELPAEIDPLRNGEEFTIRLSSRIEESEYLNLVKKAQKDIFEGDYYEVNLSHSVEFSFQGDSFSLYKAMRNAGPVPFGGYLTVDDLFICCASPERFLARNGQNVWSQPIKGTISREPGRNSTEAIEKLKSSEKERAENLMIVDLVRNDMSRVAEKNTVRVLDLFEIQSFETVHQMVSTVECRVSVGMDSIEVIKACFPMGSMTGAPKIAAMRAIEEYENYQRGVYSGALGYIKPDGDFDLNVIIRTAIIEGNSLVYPVGGAITSDSDPKAEWEETLIKARAITNILERVQKT
ncbi:anthranilate synthase component I family protein [Gracilimonas halophila]|uniref:Anthranilate synthase component I family protein n=1 Tax=Gracilimonas halophila TaxID=1834464 RepID=A0ABW5JKV3_9BACT